jgi:hypothetical protein
MDNSVVDDDKREKDSRTRNLGNTTRHQSSAARRGTRRTEGTRTAS